jgi:hypothetical protein
LNLEAASGWEKSPHTQLLFCRGELSQKLYEFRETSLGKEAII